MRYDAARFRKRQGSRNIGDLPDLDNVPVAAERRSLNIAGLTNSHQTAHGWGVSDNSAGYRSAVNERADICPKPADKRAMAKPNRIRLADLARSSQWVRSQVTITAQRDQNQRCDLGIRYLRLIGGGGGIN